MPPKEGEKPAAQSTPATGISPEVIDSLPVALVFDIGELEIPFSDFNSLQPGYTLDMNRSLLRPVTIRANGQIIGYGELIQIDDRVGVRILELTGIVND
jgi:type III secretion system YscQ/HrcQ family protein